MNIRNFTELNIQIIQDINNRSLEENELVSKVQNLLEQAESLIPSNPEKIKSGLETLKIRCKETAHQELTDRVSSFIHTKFPQVPGKRPS